MYRYKYCIGEDGCAEFASSMCRLDSRRWGCYLQEEKKIRGENE